MNNEAPYEICYFCGAIDGEHAHEPYCLMLTADEPAELFDTGIKEQAA